MIDTEVEAEEAMDFRETCVDPLGLIDKKCIYNEKIL